MSADRRRQAAELDALEAAGPNLHGWSVDDTAGGRWWPAAEAAAEIEAGDDPHATILALAIEEPMRGEWHN